MSLPNQKNIQAWKAHLLRAINQNEARLNLLQDLNPTSVLVVLDWAMKFLPIGKTAKASLIGMERNVFLGT